MEYFIEEGRDFPQEKTAKFTLRNAITRYCSIVPMFYVLFHICHSFLTQNFRAYKGTHFIFSESLGTEFIDCLPQRVLFQIRISNGFTLKTEFKMVSFPVINCDNTGDVECPLKYSCRLAAVFLACTTVQSLQCAL